MLSQPRAADGVLEVLGSSPKSRSRPKRDGRLALWLRTWGSMSQRLLRLGLREPTKAAFEEARGHFDQAELGRVSRVDRGECEVFTETETIRAVSDSQRAQDHVAPVTGDWVMTARPAEGGVRVEVVFERATALVRRDPAVAATDQVLASNIDTVAVVAALDQPQNSARIERFLVLAIDSGAEPLVVLNKEDTCRSLPEGYQIPPAFAWLDDVADVIVTSATSGNGLTELKNRLDVGTTLVFIGPSGAGKSTLVNALVGRPVVATGQVRSSDRKGRHVTTARELIEVPSGGVLIDTPGIRAIGLWAADVALDEVFPDVARFAVDCRFRDCTHRSEPGCEVATAILQGQLAAKRVSRYQLLWQELALQNEELARSRGSHGRRGR